MLFIPEVKNISSYELNFGVEPSLPENCKVQILANIGLKDQDSSDIFRFTTITHQALQAKKDSRWGWGWLILNSFT